MACAYVSFATSVLNLLSLKKNSRSLDAAIGMAVIRKDGRTVGLNLITSMVVAVSDPVKVLQSNFYDTLITDSSRLGSC